MDTFHIGLLLMQKSTRSLRLEQNTPKVCYMDRLRASQNRRKHCYTLLSVNAYGLCRSEFAEELVITICDIQFLNSFGES